MNNDRFDWREMCAMYKPYILNDMTFTFIVMVVMFIVAAIVVF